MRDDRHRVLDEPLLVVQGLSYAAGEKQILDSLSFSLKEGCVTGIVGPNGCGKSTLLSHLSRRIPSRRCVKYRGTPIERFSPAAYAREVAVLVQQGRGLSDALSAEEVVLMGRYPFKDWLGGYTEKDRIIAARALRWSGAEHLAKKRMGTLSGGERQRVRIARAFAQEPRLLLLDEPTNHLDAKHKLALMKRLRAYRMQGTVFVVLHDLSLAARFCDEVIIMQRGRIFASGTARETLVPDLLEEVFEVPFYRTEHQEALYLYY